MELLKKIGISIGIGLVLAGQGVVSQEVKGNRDSKKLEQLIGELSGEKSENVVHNYLVKPLMFGDLKEYRDPIKLESAKDREEHVNGLKKRLELSVRQVHGDELGDFVKNTNFVYDSNGEKAIEAQIIENEKDRNYLEKYGIKVESGRVKESIDDFKDKFEELKKEGSVGKMISGYRNLVAYSANGTGKGEGLDVFCFPYWFEEMQRFDRGDANAEERNYVLLADMAHEFGHVLMYRDGVPYNGIIITEKNAKEVLKIPESYVPGVIRMIGEFKARKFEKEILDKKSKYLGISFDGDVKKIEKELNRMGILDKRKK